MQESKSIDLCPLCGSLESEFHSYSLPNLYSEKIAQLSNLDENEIIKSHANLSCLDCGNIYKEKWFSEEQLDELFRFKVPTHPKGWDVVSGRFSKANFFKEVELYKKALSEKDQENINRYKRALPSIIDSIDGFDKTNVGKAILEAIAQEKPENIQVYEKELEVAIKEPAPFKRFSGFSASALWNFIEQNVSGIKNYAEVGCPLWGLMPLATEKEIPVTYFKRLEVNYWSENCRNKGMHCSEFLHEFYNIPVRNWSELPAEKQHVLGLFQYLDHLEDPLNFMKDVFDNFEVAAVILDGVDNPLAIQHFTGFTQKSLSYLAKYFNKTLHSDFEDIKPSGNILYLFT